MREPRDHGQALLAALIIAVVLGVTCASLVILALANSTACENGLRRATALSVAEIGVERAKASIANGVFDQQFATQNHQATNTDDAYSPEGNLYGSYAVRVTENHGEIEGEYLVISQGTSGRTTRQIHVVLRRKPLIIPDFLGAIMLYNPSALELFRGVPPNVCGLDTALPEGMPFSEVKASDCEPGSGDGPAALGSRTERVVGTDGSGGVEDPSVYNVSTDNPTGRTDLLTASDVAELAEAWEKAADYITDGADWYDASGHPVASGSYGTTETPCVVVLRHTSSGRLHLTGNLTGVGLLIIDCEVEFTGTFNYAGLVIITSRGEATVSVEMMGTPLVMGSILAANPAEDGTSMLDLRGTADVFYSRQGLAYAEQALAKNARFETLCYTEKSPNAGDLEVE